jgi:hypothetical protein
MSEVVSNPTVPELVQLMIDEIKDNPNTTVRWGEAMLLVGEIDRLRDQVAGIAPDASLGRMVREMPKYTELIHYGNGRWWYGHRISAFGKDADTPEAALEGVRKEK